MIQQNRIWFITGASRGFGRIWTEAALERGDKVVATARKLESIADFKEKYGDHVLTLELDVTNPTQVKNQSLGGVGRGFQCCARRVRTIKPVICV